MYPAATQVPQPKYGARFAAWQRNITDRRRDESAALMVVGEDPDMLLRICRAALFGLSGYALGHDKADIGLDLIEADLHQERGL